MQDYYHVVGEIFTIVEELFFRLCFLLTTALSYANKPFSDRDDINFSFNYYRNNG